MNKMRKIHNIGHSSRFIKGRRNYISSTEIDYDSYSDEEDESGDYDSEISLKRKTDKYFLSG